MSSKKIGSDPMKDKTKYLTWDNISSIIYRAKEEHQHIFFLLAASSGRRIGEIVPLKVDDFDFENNTVVWKIEKKRKDYKVVLPMEDRVMRKVEVYIDTKGLTDWLFPSPRLDNKPLSKRYWQRLLKKIVEEYGIKTVGGDIPVFHGIRHSVAIRILELTGDIRLAQRTLQHSDLSMTSHYLHVSNRDYKRKMEGVLNIE